MEIKEKDSKYYLVLSNGELEISKSQAESLVEKRGAIIRNNLQNWIDHFYLRQWNIKKVPDTADAFIKSGAFFDDIIREVEQICIANNYRKEITEKLLSFCNTQIEKLKTAKEGSLDAAFIDYQILCWLRLVAFVYAMAGKYP